MYLVAAAAGAGVWPLRAEASGQVATLTMTAEVHARTALRVSSSLLRFEVEEPGARAVASVDFVAAARTRREGEVVLTIWPERWVEGPGGAADVEASITFSGDEPGTFGGELAPATRVTAARWIGSGRRTGRLVFTLRAGAQGTYLLPVQFVLTAP